MSLADGSEALDHALTDRLERLEAAWPLSAAWMPTHSAERWSTATNTATWPCSVVTAAVMSVPHIASILSGMIVPSWLRGPRGRPTRLVAKRPLSRIRRRTRSLEVRSPAWRSRAQTLRWPSPWKGLSMPAPATDRRPPGPASGIGPCRSRPARRRHRWSVSGSDAAGRRPSARRPRPGRCGRCRVGGAWRSRRRRSSRRRPPCQRDAALQSLHLRAEQLVVHQDRAELRLKAARSSRRGHRAADPSGPPRPPPGTRRASRRGPPPSPRARAPPPPAARLAARAAPPRACAPPSSAAPGPGPQLRPVNPLQPRLPQALHHPSQHLRRPTNRPSAMPQRTLGRGTWTPAPTARTSAGGKSSTSG